MKKYLPLLPILFGILLLPYISRAINSQGDYSKQNNVVNPGTTVFSGNFIGDGSTLISVTFAGSWFQNIFSQDTPQIYGGVFSSSTATTTINPANGEPRGCDGDYTGRNIQYVNGGSYSTSTQIIGGVPFVTVTFSKPTSTANNLCENIAVDNATGTYNGNGSASGTIFGANGFVPYFGYFAYVDINAAPPNNFSTSSPYMVLNNSTPPNFYAQIKNTGGGRFLLRSTPASTTDSNFIKRLPQDWIVYVSSTVSATGSVVIADGFHWYDVVDPTDNVEGWMAASSSAGTIFLPYSTSTSQGALQATSTSLINTSTTRANLILQAIDYYYNNTSTANSLYSGKDGNNNLAIFKTRGYPEKVIWGIAAQEDGTPQFLFDNQIVSFDYGHGIMQITPFKVWANESSTNGWKKNTENVPANASYDEIFPCRSYDEFNSTGTNLYVNCYTFAGTHNMTSTKQYQSYAASSSNPTYKWYSNTAQSIYANIKDGMRILQNKYASPASSTPDNRVCNYTSSTVSITNGTSTTVYSCLDREIVLVTAAYNGASPSTYLDPVNGVPGKLKNIQNYFPNQTSTDIIDTINKLALAASSTVYAQLHSPGDLSLQDVEGRTIGVVNGVVKNDFSFASYDPDNKSVRIFFPQDNNFTYKVVGTGVGEYGLDISITSGGKTISFGISGVSITPNAVHTYTIDQEAILNGQNGVTFKVDNTGNGTIDSVQTFGATVTSNPPIDLIPEPSPPVPLQTSFTFGPTTIPPVSSDIISSNIFTPSPFNTSSSVATSTK